VASRRLHKDGYLVEYQTLRLKAPRTSKPVAP